MNALSSIKAFEIATGQKDCAKTRCPIKSCKKLVVNLPRHMRLVHKWNHSEAKNLKSLYGLRKIYTFKKKNKPGNAKHSRYHKAFPVYGCRAVVLNMSRHLQCLHKMQQDTDKFRQLLLDTVIVAYKAKSIRQQEEKSLCSV